jgi:beta-lactam-binding protein with PASTA domain
MSATRQPEIQSSPPPAGEPSGRRRFGPVRLVASLTGWTFRLGLDLARLAILVAVVMSLAGIASYHVVRNHIMGQTVLVPVVVDKDSTEALELLRGLGLSLKLERTEFAEQKPPGVIIDQRPKPETQVKAGSTVHVVLSGGPKMVPVPDVRGEDYKAAEVRLGEAGLRRGLQGKVESRILRQGAVVASDPPAGALAVRGSTVRLLISSGPPLFQIAMPRLTGKSREQAADLLSRLGLEIEEVREELRPDLPAGLILDQHPRPGAQVGPLHTIAVTVSTRPSAAYPAAPSVGGDGPG